MRYRFQYRFMFLQALILGSCFTAFKLKAKTYVGSVKCKSCHAKEFSDWSASDHHLAMQLPDAKSVLGDFTQQLKNREGRKVIFSEENGNYYVSIEDENRKLIKHTVAYTFGHYPLQQYLITFPKGHYQVLHWAWDSRSKKEGGQAWYNIFPNQSFASDDPQHWTGIDFRWNHMCAECHSTNLVKNYDPKNESYNTTFSELNVACEACHGPASAHLNWTQQLSGKLPSQLAAMENKGFNISLSGLKQANWIFKPGAVNAHKKDTKLKANWESMCGGCHARRVTIKEGFTSGDQFLDYYKPLLLDPAHYHPDGYVNDEVFVWGSFTQSKMHRKGVQCMDCHNAHSLKINTSIPEKICSRCHLPNVYDQASHHFHQVQAPSCIDCHMPRTTFMQVDARADHSMRIPRPDLSLIHDGPNACNKCHKDQDPAWAQAAIQKWYPKGKWKKNHFAQTFVQAIAQDPASIKRIDLLLQKPKLAAIVKASSLSLLKTFIRTHNSALKIVLREVDSAFALIRLAAADALGQAAPQLDVFRALMKLSNDPRRSVRVEAARSLSVYMPVLPPKERQAVAALVESVFNAEKLHLDTFEANYNIGLIYQNLGDPGKSINYHQKSLDINPYGLSSMLNLANAFQQNNQDLKGESPLRQAYKLEPTNPLSALALSKWLIRNNRKREAFELLKTAAAIVPLHPEVGLLYGLALEEIGKQADAIGLWKGAIKYSPYYRNLYVAIIESFFAQGKPAEAKEWQKIMQEKLRE